MKKYLLTTTLLLLSIVIQAASPSIIQGKWNRGGNTVSLYHIVSGRLEVLSTYNVQEDRNFAFALAPEKEGYYVVGSGHTGAKTDKYLFYFKPGDNLNVEITEDSYKLIGNNTPENQALQDWQDKTQPLELLAIYFFKSNSTYVDFFPLLDDFIENKNTVVKTDNPVFNKSFEKMSQLDLLSIAMIFINTPRTAHPQMDEYIDYYREINISELTTDDSMLGYPFGASMITQIINVKQNLEGKKEKYAMAEVMNMLQNDAIRGEYTLSQAAYLKTYLGYQDLMNTNQKYLVSQDQISRAKEIETKLAKESKEGELAIDFTYKDINNKEYSLSDFRGKVVVVDVWATWCGPCIAQMPHLKTISKEYQGKDLVFMGISVDEEKDYEKWKEFVKKEDSPGIQLYAGGFDSDIAKFYDINAIPRFMVFGKDGTIVSKNAPRPSDKELRLLLDEELKK